MIERPRPGNRRASARADSSLPKSRTIRDDLVGSAADGITARWISTPISTSPIGMWSRRARRRFASPRREPSRARPRVRRPARAPRPSRWRPSRPVPGSLARLRGFAPGSRAPRLRSWCPSRSPGRRIASCTGCPPRRRRCGNRGRAWVVSRRMLRRRGLCGYRRGRSVLASSTLRSRTFSGVISTHSSSRRNSIACSSDRVWWGINRTRNHRRSPPARSSGASPWSR